MTIPATQWHESLQQHLESTSRYAPADAPEDFLDPEEQPQLEAARPNLSGALNGQTLATAVRTPNRTTKVPSATAHLKDAQFSAGTLDRQLINAIDATQLQRSPLAIRAKPKWTVAARQVYRQIPPVPTLTQPVVAGNFLLFPDPVWDFVTVAVPRTWFIQQPQKEHWIIDRDKLQTIERHNVQLRPINQIHNPQIRLEAIAVHRNQLRRTSLPVSDAIATAAVPIDSRVIHQANLLSTLSAPKGRLRVRRAFFAPTQPWMTDFKLVVRHQHQEGRLQTVGGTAYLTVSLYSQSDDSQLTQHRATWTDALENAGYGTHLWKFIPVNIRKLQASLDLPPNCSAETSADLEDGTVTFVIQLSAAVTQAWRQALESRQPYKIAGVCRFQVDYFARDNFHLRRNQQQLSASLPALLRNATPDMVQLLDPDIAIHTAIEVRGSSLVDSVALDWRPNTGAAPIHNRFGPDGGTLTGTVTTADLPSLSIAWQALVTYGVMGWSAMARSGTLSSSLLRDIVKPTSADWVQQYVLFPAYMKNRNELAIEPGDLEPFEDIEVEATLTLKTASLKAPLVTTVTLGNTEMTQIPFPVLADAASGEIGLAVTTTSLSGDRPLHSVTEALSAADDLINIKIYGDGKIEIQLSSAPSLESSVDGEIFSVLESLL
ncbi:MAG: hypothetical protein WBA10_14760 [Elainellaceae cyanobacterium]